MTSQFHHPFSFGITTRSGWVDYPNGTDLWIFEYTVSGRGLIRIRGKTVYLTAGDMVIFKPGAPQDFGTDPAIGRWVHLWACFAPRPEWLDWLHWPELTPGLLYLTAPAGALRRRLRRRLEEALAHNRSSRKRRIEFVMNILEEILLWCDTFNPIHEPARLDPRLKKTLEVIYKDYARPWPLAAQARIACLSPWHFAHLFKNQMGQTSRQWITAYRLVQATDLLVTTDKTLAEIAAKTGFDNPFYFSRVFRRNYGISPSMYRRRAGIP